MNHEMEMDKIMDRREVNQEWFIEKFMGNRRLKYLLK